MGEILHRRAFIGSTTLALLGLSACGGGSSDSVVAATSTTPPASPPPAPTPAPPPPPAIASPAGLQWVLEGDSYMLGASSWSTGQRLGEDLINNAVGGSSFQAIHDRIVGNPALRANPLIIWDGNANGHVLGEESATERALLADIVAFKKPYRNWLYVRSVSVFPGPGLPTLGDPLVGELRALGDKIAQVYGAEHVWDALPIMQARSNGSHEDVADVAAGYPPRSVLFDGLHPDEATKIAITTAWAAPNGPMAKVRLLTD